MIAVFLYRSCYDVIVLQCYAKKSDKCIKKEVSQMLSS